MKSSTIKLAGTKTKGKTSFLFLLAILMLVLSCPLKRLMQAGNQVPASAQQSVRWMGMERQAKAYQTVSCCAQKQKVTLNKPVIRKQHIPAPSFVGAQHLQTGFAIHAFLDGTVKHFNSSIPVHLSPLPLFLQHRRLLI